MAKRSRQFSAVADKIGHDHYSAEEALKMLRENRVAKFNETVELHLSTSADPRQQDQQVREVTVLPHGLGKPVRVLVFTTGQNQDVALKAGADYVGDEDLINKIQKGWTDFDVSIASQEIMPQIAKLGRILGRKGLMPSPKSGTVVKSDNIPAAVNSAKKGRVEVRMDKTGNIHVPIGRIEFESDALLENLTSVYDIIRRAKPTGIKGSFIRSATVCTTMSPGVKLNMEDLDKQKV